MEYTAIIRGGGDLGTGVAYHLNKLGVRVVITELAHPKMVRHTVCLGYAVYNGTQHVEDLTAQLVSLPEFLENRDITGEAIPVIIDSEDKAIAAIKPQFLFDCRMLKYDVPNQLDLAPVVVGLGPGFCAGSRWDEGCASSEATADFVIETQRGEHLGDVLRSGRPIPNTGVPGVIAGESSRRLLRAPQTGSFRGIHQVGDLVDAGEIVGYVGDKPVITEISGKLRGLVHDGLEVSDGEKIGDCDPRGEAVSAFEISDKSHAIGEAAASICSRLIEKLGEKARES